VLQLSSEPDALAFVQPPMGTRLVREFEVTAPRDAVWEHLARVEAWPSWARHIRSVTLSPPGPLGPESSGAFRLAGGISSAFHMTSFDPPESWAWRGPFQWLTIDYDHRFEETADGGTRVTFVVDASGMLSGVVGRVFAAVYARNLGRAIPLLVEEIEAGTPIDDER
jgi:hypothetical protein